MASQPSRPWIAGIRWLRPITGFVPVIILIALVAIPATYAQTFSVVYTFKGPPDGGVPSDLLLWDGGNLYGTTIEGGTHGFGTVFEIDASGNETVLYSFAGGLDGEYPYGGLVRDAAGNLYGTTEAGGNPDCSYPSSCGTVFKLDPQGNETVLYRFGALPDGNYPYSETLVLDEEGSIYGTTLEGGDSSCFPGYGCGTVFKVDQSGKETILHMFSGLAGLDGELPYAGLVRDQAGNLYGSTSEGGAPGCTNGCGVVFELKKVTGSGRWSETVLHRFGALEGGTVPTGVIVDDAGNLYGATGARNSGGPDGVFKLNQRSQETVLYYFTQNSGSPDADLTLDPAGNIYGTTIEGGASFAGAIFELDTARNFTILHSFTDGADGGYPHATLARDDDGNLYGTASSGGITNCNLSGCGVVYKVTP